MPKPCTRAYANHVTLVLLAGKIAHLKTFTTLPAKHVGEDFWLPRSILLKSHRNGCAKFDSQKGGNMLLAVVPTAPRES